VLQVFNEGNDNLYGMAMPVLTKRLKQQELLALFRNEANNMMEALSNPANLPTGKELDLIISNFGSLDAYRQKIQERIDSLLKPNGEGYKTLLNVLKPSYWSQR
jgi:superoxide dismutase